MQKVGFSNRYASRVAIIFSDTFPEIFPLCFGQEAAPVFCFCFSYGVEVAIFGCFVLGASVKSEVGVTIGQLFSSPSLEVCHDYVNSISRLIFWVFSLVNILSVSNNQLIPQPCLHLPCKDFPRGDRLLVSGFIYAVAVEEPGPQYLSLVIFSAEFF